MELTKDRECVNCSVEKAKDHQLCWHVKILRGAHAHIRKVSAVLHEIVYITIQQRNIFHTRDTVSPTDLSDELDTKNSVICGSQTRTND